MKRLRARLAGRGDAGMLALELAVLAPVIFLLLFGAIQAGLYFHAREVAHHAASRGVEVARAHDAPSGAGDQAAAEFLDRMGGSVDSPSVSSAGSTDERVRIEVRGSVVTLVPGLSLDVTARAEAPKEGWTE